MKIVRALEPTLAVALLIFCFSVVIFAQELIPQKAPESKEQSELKAKTLALLSEVVDESASLKLLENRVFVYTIAARLLWEQDAKRARLLVQNAAAELRQIQASIETRAAEDQNRVYYWRIISHSLRSRLLHQIKQKDAQFALEISYATRSPELQQAVDIYQGLLSESGKPPDLNEFKHEERERLQKADEEVRLEQELKKEAIKNDPLKLAANIRESIRKDADFHQILVNLNELNQKDHEAAQKLFDEFTGKIAASEPRGALKSYLAYLFYTQYLPVGDKPPNAKDKPVKLEVDEKKIKAIANQEFDRLLIKEISDNDFQFTESLIYLRKILPNRFPEIAAKFDRVKGGSREWADDAEATDRLGSDPPLAQIIKNSDRLNGNSRTNYYRRAVTKMIENTAAETIAQTLEQIPDAKDRRAALDYLTSISAERKAQQANFDDAKKALAEISSVSERIGRYIALATFYHQKKTAENQQIAEDLLAEALKLVNRSPETATQLDALLPVVTAYAQIKLQTAVEIIAPLIARLNELIQARVVLSSFDDKSYPYISENEIVFGAQDSYYSYRGQYGEIVKKLAAHDFLAARRLIESFDRPDVRLIAKLSLIEGILEK